MAKDCERLQSCIPESRGERPTIASAEYEMIANNPYRYTSDEVLFVIWSKRKGVPRNDENWEKFFSAGRACLRASPLVKQYGFGLHFDQDGKVALYGVESAEYERFANDPDIRQLRALSTVRV